MTPASVKGHVASGFEPVRQVFDECQAEVGRGGAAFAVYANGRLVVDLWTGWAGREPWQSGTRGVLMSVTKGVAAVAVARLADSGLLDVDAPVAAYWPEFAAGGKDRITVAELLTHAAGLIGVPRHQEIVGPNGEGWGNTGEILERLESATPEWPPGSGHSYHVLTYGWLVGELVRRVSGRSIGTFIRDEISTPLGIELDLGTPLDRQGLVAPVLLPEEMPADVAATWGRPMSDPSSPVARAHLAVDGSSFVTNSAFFAPEMLEIELSAVNATGTARALATLYGSLADDPSSSARPVSATTVAKFAAERRRGPDLVTGLDARWALGFMRPVPPPAGAARVWGHQDAAFGHTGFGGQLSFADPVNRMGVALVRSHLSWTSSLGSSLVRTVYECLERSGGGSEPVA